MADKKYQTFMKQQQAERDRDHHKMVMELLAQQAKDKAEAERAKKARANAEGMAELKRSQLEKLPQLTFEQKLAQIKLELDQIRHGTLNGKPKKRNSTFPSQMKPRDRPFRELPSSEPNAIPTTHKGSNSPSHMLKEHVPAFFWPGQPTPSGVPVWADEASNHRSGLGPLVEYDYLRKGKDWEGKCRSGRAQSPVKLVRMMARPSNGLFKAGDTQLTLRYDNVTPDQKLRMKHNGHAIVVDGEDLFGYLEAGLNKSVFNVKRLVFHAPSEHAADYSRRADGLFDMEMQIIHQKSHSVRADEVVIISVLFELQTNTNNTFLDSLEWDSMPTKAGTKRFLGSNVTLANAADWSSPYFSYIGSITKPPCAEGVRWHVVKKPAPIGTKQLERINKLFSANPKFANGEGNNRALQKWNSRPGGLTISA